MVDDGSWDICVCVCAAFWFSVLCFLTHGVCDSFMLVWFGLGLFLFCYYCTLCFVYSGLSIVN